MASWTVAPAVKAALAEATRRWPERSRSCDGTIGDTAHSARKSDHNPDRDGVVLAFDLTHDPGSGCDAHALVRQACARRDPRIKYAISQGRIWSAARAAEGWRPYSGSNRHDKHAHVSVVKARAADTRPWWTAAPKPAPAQPQEAPEMTPAEWQRLEKLIDDRVRILIRAETADGRDTGHPNLRDINLKLDALHKLLTKES